MSIADSVRQSLELLGAQCIHDLAALHSGRCIERANVTIYTFADDSDLVYIRNVPAKYQLAAYAAPMGK